ncbi:MAG TPA: glucosidase [Aliidongia sp.]|nr:glucosidase [Aliidongia sp.]
MPESITRETETEITATVEGRRLKAVKLDKSWRRWGPYLSERQWGTVREDYSAGGTAWDYLPHDHARSRAYRWGEDGLGGFGDCDLNLCLGLALWNGRDPMLKERLFGLTNSQGNHGEDVKELYYYLDGTPTHAYMRMLYKYPQGAFPYAHLIEENARRGSALPEYELIDTGLFDEARYFDVEIEYAKADPDDILMLVTVTNRGPDTAELHVLPQLWARNFWSWRSVERHPILSMIDQGTVLVRHPDLPEMRLVADGECDLLFCDNDTNMRRLYGMDVPGYFKDGINDYVVDGDTAAVNPAREGSKLAAHYRLRIPPQGKAQVRIRLAAGPAHGDFDTIMAARRTDADEFYGALQQDIADADARLVQRQAFAGMLWSKQFYYIDIPQWLKGDPAQPTPPEGHQTGRNADWFHLNNADIISMPDKWEFPWYAAWDLAFHCVTFARIDPEFAKSQLVLLTREWYMHPNGQLPAYEWAFGDVNPPVHACAVWRVYRMDRAQNGGVGDRAFLERVFHKLMLNFTWWVNRKDSEGRNIFEGGFLGLDNIGIFDRSAPLPTGGYIQQSDGTAWMAMYTLDLMRIALELALDNPVYEDIATKFFEHFLYIAEAMTHMGGDDMGLWDETDQFYYDVLRLPGGERVPLRVRSMVGLIPLFAVEVLDSHMMERLPDFATRLNWFLDYRPDLALLVSRWMDKSGEERHLLSLLRGHRLKQLLRRMLDETEFLSDYGVRAVSKFHEQHPYVFEHAGQQFSIGYVPGESTTELFGGNSNWRGPVWMPVNYLIIEALLEHHQYYGEDFKVECPVGSGSYMNLKEVAQELATRLARLFLRDAEGRRPVLGRNERLQTDPAFRDLVLFHEYFHGDTGRGLGASHQTGWTGLVALLLEPKSCDAIMAEQPLATDEITGGAWG